MKVTEVRIRPVNEEFVKAYASISFDDCFVVHDIRVIKGPNGLFISFPNRTESEGGQRDIAFPVNVETRNMIEQAVLEYEKVVVAAIDGYALGGGLELAESCMLVWWFDLLD